MSNSSGVLALTTDRNSVHRGVCMRRKLLSYWLAMSVLVFTLYLAILYTSGVFSQMARRLSQDLTVSVTDTCADMTAHFDTLEARSIRLSRKASAELGRVLGPGEGMQSLDDHPSELEALEQTMLPELESILRSGQCSGAFIILDATVNSHAPGALHSRSGLYLRCQGLYAANPVNQNITCYRGYQNAARAAGIELHNRWNPEFDIDQFSGFSWMMGQSVDSLSGGLFWTRCTEMQDTWEKTLLLCVPVTLGDGTVCGLCGIELSELYFRLSYPAQKGEFGSRITALGFSDGGAFSLSGGMIGGQEGTSLRKDQDLEIRKEAYFDTINTKGDTYLGIEKSLPFRTQDGSTMMLAVLMPQESYGQEQERYRVAWAAGSVVFFFVMLILSFFFTERFTGPIEKSLEVAGKDDRNCGILEIDELLETIQRAADSREGLPPRVESFLTDFCEKVQTLTPMERTVLQYYIDGYGIEEIAAEAFISIYTVKKHNSNINRKLGVSTREELQVYIEIFRRCGRIEEISCK